MAVACGSCHVGGSLVEKSLITTQPDSNLRHSMRQPDMTGATANAYTHYVAEYFTPGLGKPAHYVNDICMNSPLNSTGLPVVAGQSLKAGVAGNCPPSPTDVTIVPDDANPASLGFMPAFAPWSMPGTFDNQYTAANGSNAVVPGDFVTNAMGWAPAEYVAFGMAVSGQMMMPNVREMDCFMCHLQGYNNIINSAAVQMGYLNASPSMSSGLMNMFSQTYMPGTFTLGTPMAGFEAFGAPASLSGSVLARINGSPDQENCRQCHSPTTMEDMPAMFDEFLAAAPMQFSADPSLQPNGSLLNGMAMPGYDLNSPLIPGGMGMTSPEVVMNFSTFGWEYVGGGDASGPFGIFPMALDAEWGMFNADGTPNTGVAGGGKDGYTGPLFYAGATAPGFGDQNALKKATIPFPRADFFKRGDIWDNKIQEVHYSFGCAGCHFDTNSLNPDLNQCDPGRGYERMGGVESGKLGGIDTRNTVKRCENCHITGTNNDGEVIETFSAPNPGAAHANAGLLAQVTTAIGTDGTNLVPLPNSTHMDVVDCTVCHIYKKSMAVRSLDSTSGNRYPAMIGFPQDKGMFGMFTDPMNADAMDDDTAIGAVQMNMGNQGFRTESIDMMMNMTLYGAEFMMANLDPYQQTWFYSIALQPGDPGCPTLDPDGNPVTCSGTWTVVGDPTTTPNHINNLMAIMPQYFPGMPAGSSLGDAARAMLKAEMQEWKPIYGWSPNSNKTVNGQPNPDFRLRVVPINFIVAQMWDDSHSTYDANGDQAELNPAWDGHIEWDPPIQRNMKAGMNFVGGPFATIPVGFGTGLYQSAYGDGTVITTPFSGNFDFVGVYGGNVMLTTPDEIAAYKTHRNSADDGISSDVWTGTQLVFFGGNPFQVTHNVVDTQIHALGKKKADGSFGCTDCHSADAEFFTGEYDMTGSAVPASATYDYDMSGYSFGLDMADPIASDMMQRPVVDFEVTAYKDDLRTGSEAMGTDMVVYDVEFDECLAADETTVVPCDGGSDVYRRTHDLERSEFLYPDLAEQGTLAAKLASVLDVSAAIADIEAPLESVTINVDPVATTDTPVTVPANALVYNISDYGFDPVTGEIMGTALDASTGSVTFTEAGVYRVVVSTTNILGQTIEAAEYVIVEGPPPGAENITFSNSGTTPAYMKAQVDNIPALAVTASVSWDGGASYDSFEVTDPSFAMTFDGPEGVMTGTFQVSFYGADMMPLANWSDSF